MKIAFFGSSLVSAYWNGAATYYRGIIGTLHARGHEVTFYEPDIFDRQKHRDLDAVPYAKSVVYEAREEQAVRQLVQEAAAESDVVIKASGVGAFDEVLESAVLDHKSPNRAIVFWDVDAPATLESLDKNARNPLRELVPEYDLILTYGGGEPVATAYRAFGARKCVPVYNAFDPETHHPAPRDPRFEATLGFVGNRLPDREARVLEFFHGAAKRLPGETFLLAGSGWDKNVAELPNIRRIGHLYTRDHNAFNVTPRAVLNILRDGMVRFGFSPATRVFEAAGAGACLITDKWKGIELFLEPNKECLVADNGEEVARHLENLDPDRARAIGEAALQRVLSAHTYGHRGEQVENLLLNAKQTIPLPFVEARFEVRETA